MNPSRIRSLWLMGGGVALLLTGACMTIAGAAAYRAESFMTAWSQKGREPADLDWGLAAAAAHSAIEFYPVRNGAYLDRLGRMHAWRMYQHPAGDRVAQPSRQEALAAYRHATEARVTWPDGWARLASTKLMLLEVDAEFERAMAAADRQGKNRREVNEEVAGITLRGWAMLDEQQRRRGERHAIRLLAYGRPGIEAFRYYVPQMACLRLSEQLPREPLPEVCAAGPRPVAVSR